MYMMYIVRGFIRDFFVEGGGGILAYDSVLKLGRSGGIPPPPPQENFEIYNV
jgi:hypothetical protein